MSGVLTIDRAKWRRGGQNYPFTTHGAAALLNDKGYMCCLGFDALACGVSAERMLNVIAPTHLGDGIPAAYASRQVPHAEPFIDDAIVANDDPALDDDARESRVRKALIGLGWDDVVFV